jgi:hypothetical protein
MIYRFSRLHRLTLAFPPGRFLRLHRASRCSHTEEIPRDASVHAFSRVTLARLHHRAQGTSAGIRLTFREFLESHLQLYRLQISQRNEVLFMCPLKGCGGWIPMKSLRDPATPPRAPPALEATNAGKRRDSSNEMANQRASQLLETMFKTPAPPSACFVSSSLPLSLSLICFF